MYEKTYAQGAHRMKKSTLARFASIIFSFALLGNSNDGCNCTAIQLPPISYTDSTGISPAYSVFVESQDVGGLWSEIDSLAFARKLTAGSFTNTDNIFILVGQDTANRATIWLSTDNGFHWASALTLINGTTTFNDITHTPGYARLVAVSSGGQAFLSNNNGVTWAAQSSAGPALNGVDFFEGANIGVAVGNNGTILRSVDAGSNWAAVSSGTAQDLFGVHCIGSPTSPTDTIVAVGAGGTIVRSTDAGLTWAVTTLPRSMILKAVSFSGLQAGRYGIAVGNNRAIFKTTDNGNNWTEISYFPGYGNHEDVVVSADGSKGVAMNSNAGTTIYISTDRGQQWNPTSPGLPGHSAIEGVYLYKFVFRNDDLNGYVFAVGVPN